MEVCIVAIPLHGHQAMNVSLDHPRIDVHSTHCPALFQYSKSCISTIVIPNTRQGRGFPPVRLVTPSWAPSLCFGCKALARLTICTTVDMKGQVRRKYLRNYSVLDRERCCKSVLVAVEGHGDDKPRPSSIEATNKHCCLA